MSPSIPPVTIPPDVPAWLRGKTLADLDAIEHGGRVLIPENIRRRGPRGDEVLVPVMVQVPTEQERALARIDAIKHVADMRKGMRIETVEAAQAAIGNDVFENLDTFAILARCVLEPKAPHGRAYMLDILIGTFPPSSLFDLYLRVDFYARLYNPRIEDMDEAMFWPAVLEIARVRNLGPLAAIGGGAQNAFITRMAVELSSSRMLKSSSPSSATSTPGS